MQTGSQTAGPGGLDTDADQQVVGQGDDCHRQDGPWPVGEAGVPGLYQGEDEGDEGGQVRLLHLLH